VPAIRFPESLPVSARRDEIARAIQTHPVVVVSGETGSGKTTQLPKIALALGRGGAGKRIGHTQPRRIAASSVAKRIAHELESPLGDVVGYKVRFSDRLQPGASIKLMTDGILLAETQGDPLLCGYDTLIVDEAHERSLNIDFLLGYLKQLLPRRPDLKLIVTSATIDAERFAAHFAAAQGPAPVIHVSGRMYPVEQRWRPFDQAKDYRLDQAIADAVDELWREGSGDILVFLPGEREIRDAAEHLHRHLAQKRAAGVDVLPLYARLSQAEQERVFESGGGRRIVLATNVAETSLTVPGVRYVIDSGQARVKRYSYRNKVEQLQVEPISQASAAQRAGRCGRVANGVCIRLYAEDDYASRPRYTDPEILRSSLAGVILRMKALGLGAVEEFPFVEPPPRRAIADGYALLGELNAVDDDNALTPIGAELARLPLDPRIGRMILEARGREALAEVLIIAAALSGQDVRDRPLDQQPAADQKHKQFDDEKSEFAGTLKLWKWIEEARGSHGHRGTATDTHRLSNRQQDERLRDHFISPRRVREWRDIHSQLHTVVAEHGWRLNPAPATYEQLHLSLLAGLLGNIGVKSDDDDWYLGARGIRFWRHPGAHLAKKPARWIVAAELVETTRLYARGIAAIEPRWLPGIAGHLLKKQLLEPHWEKKAAEVIALERATLYGIVIYANKRVNYASLDPAAAREIFIRAALVEGDWDTRLPFLAHNRKLVREVRELEHKARRQDVLVDDELIVAFYDRQLPAEVTGGASCERWYRAEASRRPGLLMLSRDELMRHEAAGITTNAFPRIVRLGGIDCAATYLHEPGDSRDGITVTVPIYALNQVSEERCEWLVPGMLREKVVVLLKGLNQRTRSRLVPLPESAQAFVDTAAFGDGSLLDALRKAVRERTQHDLARADFKPDQLPRHLLMNLRLVDEHGRQLATGRNVAALKAEWGGHARSAFAALAGVDVVAETAPSPQPTRQERESRPSPPLGASGGLAPRYTDWTFGDLPELMEVRRGAQTLAGFPALIDKGTAVEIEVFDEPAAAEAAHRAGLRRLVALQLKESIRALRKSLFGLQQMAIAYLPLGTGDELSEQIVEAALDRVFLAAPLPSDRASFETRVAEGRSRFGLVAQEMARQAALVLGEYQTVLRKLRDAKPGRDVAADVEAQLKRLVPKRFVQETPEARLPHLARYLQGIAARLSKLRADPARDAARMAELRPLEVRYLRALAERKGVADARLDEFRWLLEELRVSLFAQELRTPQPVSVKRLDKAWSQLTS